MNTKSDSDGVMEAVDAVARCSTTDRFRDKLLEAHERKPDSKPVFFPAEVLVPHVELAYSGSNISGENTSRSTFAPAGRKTLAAILGDAELCPKSAMDQLRKLEAEYVETSRKQAPYSLSRANQYFDAQKRRMIENAHADTLPAPEQIMYRDREDLQNEFRHRWQAFDEVMKRINREALQFIIPIWQKAADIVFESMRAFEHEERARAEQYDVAWAPSNVYRAHATLLLECHKRIDSLKKCKDGVFQSHVSPSLALHPIAILD